MHTAVIYRDPSTDDGTFGKLILDTGWTCFSGELPWRDNMRGLSCIQPGAYNATWLLSPTHGWCYHLMGVPGRSEVEIHSANYCGDKQLGKMCDLMGCIALGLNKGLLSGQEAILESRAAIERFHALTKHEPLQLVIHKAQDIAINPELSV